MVKLPEATHVIGVANDQLIDQETKGDDTGTWCQKVHECDTNYRWLFCLNFVLLGSYLYLSEHEEELEDWCRLEKAKYYVESIGYDTRLHAHIICITLNKSLTVLFLMRRIWVVVVVAEITSAVYFIFVSVKVEKCWVIDYPRYDDHKRAQVEHSEWYNRDFPLLDHDSPKVEH